MILNAIGLSLNFVGTLTLIIQSYRNFISKQSYTQVYYPDTPEKRKVYKYDKIIGKGSKQVKITKFEKWLLFSLGLILLGFLFQIIDVLVS